MSGPRHLTAKPEHLHFEPFVHLVDVDDDQALSEDEATLWPVRAVDDVGTLHTVAAVAPDGEQTTMPIAIRRDPDPAP